MGLLSRRIPCKSCHSKDTHVIVSKSAGQFKSRFLFGRAYYCCRCGNRGRAGGGLHLLKLSTISMLSSILLLSLYGNFVGFQPINAPQEKPQEITIDPTLDPLLLVIDTADQTQFSSPMKLKPTRRSIASVSSLRQFKPTSLLGKSMAKLKTNIPIRWHQ